MLFISPAKGVMNRSLGGAANSVSHRTSSALPIGLLRRQSEIVTFAQAQWRSRVIMGNPRWRTWRVFAIGGEETEAGCGVFSPQRRGNRFNLFLMRSVKRASRKASGLWRYDLLLPSINSFPPLQLGRMKRLGSCWKIAFHREMIFHVELVLFDRHPGAFFIYFFFLCRRYYSACL